MTSAVPGELRAVRQARAAAVRAARNRRSAAARDAHPWAFTGFWAAWVLAGIAVELVAILNRRPGDTLSEHVWMYLTGHRHPVDEPAWAVWAGRVLILIFCGWLGPHLAFGIWG